MWVNVSDDEHQVSKAYSNRKAQDLPATIDAYIPDTPKMKTDATPVRADNVNVGSDDEESEEDRIGNGGEVPEDQDGAEPPLKSTHVNTTMFPFWSNLSTVKDDLPTEENGKDWLSNGFYYPDKATT